MRSTLFFVLFFSFVAAFGQPKAVKNAYASVASVLAYKDGTLKADGSAVFVGGMEIFWLRAKFLKVPTVQLS